MSLLDNLPHTATAKIRTRTADGIGGVTDTFAAVWSDRACWQQVARDSEVEEFSKRGVKITDKVYFVTRPELDERHILVITNGNTGVTATYEVRSRAEPDASAGLGVVYRVMCELTTTGSTP